MVRTIEAMRISFVGRRTCSSGSFGTACAPSATSTISVGDGCTPTGGSGTTSGTKGCEGGMDIGATLPGRTRATGSGFPQRSGRDGRAPALGAGGPGPGDVVEPVRLGVAPRLAHPALAGAPRRDDGQDRLGDLGGG